MIILTFPFIIKLFAFYIMNTYNKHNIALSNVVVGRPVIFTISSKDNKGSSYTTDKVGTILNKHDEDGNISFDIQLISSIDAKIYEIELPHDAEHRETCHFSIIDRKMPGNYIKINIMFDQIKLFCEPSKDKNANNIAEADIKIGDLVKIKTVNDNGNFVSTKVIITNILPGLPGKYSFIYKLVRPEESVSTIYRGPFENMYDDTIGIKSILQIHHPSKNVEKYTLLDIVKLHFAKGIIRKVSNVNRSINNRYSSDYLVIEGTPAINPGWYDEGTINDEVKEKSPLHIAKYTRYFAHTSRRPTRTINDRFSDMSIYFQSSRICLLDLNNRYNAEFYQPTDKNALNSLYPTQRSIVYGIVEMGSGGPYYSSCTIVTPQFLFLWTLVMYGNSNPTTKQLTPGEIKEKLMLVNFNDILNNDNLSYNEKLDKCKELKPFIGSVDMSLDRDFYWNMYNLIFNYTMNDFLIIAKQAKIDFTKNGYLINSLHKAAFTIYNMGWYKFNDF